MKIPWIYIDCTLRNFQGQLVLNNEPSRWQGSLELDWIHTAQPARVTGLKFCDLHFSDHNIIECSVAMPRRDMTSGSLQQTPCWTKPEQVSSEWWRSHL